MINTQTYKNNKIKKKKDKGLKKLEEIEIKIRRNLRDMSDTAANAIVRMHKERFLNPSYRSK